METLSFQTQPSWGLSEENSLHDSYRGASMSSSLLESLKGYVARPSSPKTDNIVQSTTDFYAEGESPSATAPVPETATLARMENTQLSGSPVNNSHSVSPPQLKAVSEPYDRLQKYKNTEEEQDNHQTDLINERVLVTSTIREQEKETRPSTCSQREVENEPQEIVQRQEATPHPNFSPALPPEPIQNICSPIVASPTSAQLRRQRQVNTFNVLQQQHIQLIDHQLKQYDEQRSVQQSDPHAKPENMNKLQMTLEITLALRNWLIDGYATHNRLDACPLPFKIRQQKASEHGWDSSDFTLQTNDSSKFGEKVPADVRDRINHSNTMLCERVKAHRDSKKLEVSASMLGLDSFPADMQSMVFEALLSFHRTTQIEAEEIGVPERGTNDKLSMTRYESERMRFRSLPQTPQAIALAEISDTSEPDGEAIYDEIPMTATQERALQLRERALQLEQFVKDEDLDGVQKFSTPEIVEYDQNGDISENADQDGWVAVEDTTVLFNHVLDDVVTHSKSDITKTLLNNPFFTKENLLSNLEGSKDRVAPAKLAADNNNIAVAKLLIKKEAELKQQKPFHIAVMHGIENLFSRLFNFIRSSKKSQDPFDVSVEDFTSKSCNDKSALHYAIDQGMNDLALEMMQSEGFVMTEKVDGYDEPWLYVIQLGRFELFCQMLEKLTDPRPISEFRSYLLEAILYRQENDNRWIQKVHESYPLEALQP